MAGISGELEYVLEYADEKLLNYVLYLQDPTVVNLPENQALCAIETAMQIGQQAMLYTEDKDEDVTALVTSLGITRLYMIDEDKQGNSVRAFYDADTKDICVNLYSVKTTYRIMQIYNLPYFSEHSLYKMHVLHELYHHIESSIAGHTDDIVKKRLNLRPNLSILRDIAAFSFVNSYLSDFPCQISDWLWRCYFYPSTKKLIRDKVKSFCSNTTLFMG